MVALSEDITGRAGDVIAQPVRIRVRDQFGSAFAGAAVTWEITAGGGVLEQSSSITAADGEAEASWRLGPEPGLNALTARVAGLPPVVIEAQSWRVQPDAVALTSLGDSAVVTAEFGGETGPVALSLISESRWLEERQVASIAGLQRGVVHAMAPGVLTLQVGAFGMSMGTLEATVLPSGPAIYSATQPRLPADATVELRGYRMDDLGVTTITVAGETVSGAALDSARFRIDPGLSDDPLCALFIDAALMVDAQAASWSSDIRQPTESEQLAPGETQTLHGGDFCLKLAPAEGAGYAIAQLERSWIDHALTDVVYWNTTTYPRYNLSLIDHNNAGSPQRGVDPSASLRSMTAGDPPAGVGPAGVPGEPSFESRSAPLPSRQTPFDVGDTFESRRSRDDATEVTWVVVRTYPPNLVLAIPRADSATLWQEPLITRMDDALTFVGTAPIQSMFQTVFGSVAARLSEEVGQYIVMIPLSENTAHSSTCGSTLTGSRLVGLRIVDGEALILPIGEEAFVQQLGGALAIGWNCANAGPNGASWAGGFVRLVSTELLRRVQGLGFAANYGFNGIRSWWEIPDFGVFGIGGAESASFMRYQALELWQNHGLSWDDALAVVIRGAQEGWYGMQIPPGGPGLTARMRALGDPQWDPVDARLDWVLSIAVDDRTEPAADEFGYAPVEGAWRHAENTADHIIWDTHFYRGTLVAGSAMEILHHGFAGDNGYVLMDDPAGLGAALEASSDVNSIVWRILRYR